MLERMVHAGLAVGSERKVGGWADGWLGVSVNAYVELVRRSDG